MREKIKFKVCFIVEYDVQPGEWQSSTENEEDDPSTPKVLHTREEIVEDLKDMLKEEWDEAFDCCSLLRVYSVKEHSD